MRARLALVLLVSLTVVLVVAASQRWPSPMPASANGVVAIAAGGEHTCAIVSGGELKCWGRNAQGQLGDNHSCGQVCDEPEIVTDMHSGVSVVGAGSQHTCAVNGEGALMCWGQNNYGQLGDNTFENSDTPVEVCGEYNLVTQRCDAPLTGVLEVTGGESHTCALLDTGGVECWGSDLFSQLGDERPCDAGCSLPGFVKGITANVIAIASGTNHTCALMNTGSVKCWGENDHGQLGNGTHIEHDTAVDVCNSFGQACPPLLTGATAIAAGGDRTCVLMNSGHARCWGENADEDDPAQLVSPRICSPSCEAPAELCLDYTNAPDPPGCAVELTNVSAITVGLDHACLLRNTVAMCFGDNERGQLGAGNSRCVTLLCTEAIEVCTTKACTASLTGVTAITAGWNHTCAMVSGTVKCWGYDHSGQIGDDGEPQTDCDCSKAPLPVAGIKGSPPPTATATRTRTFLPSVTPTVTRTPTPTETLMPGVTLTPTHTHTPTHTPTRTPPDTAQCGDVNGDGSLNPIDAQLLFQYIAGLIQTFREPDKADVNGDGLTNAVDAQLILQRSAGFAVQLHC